MNNKYDRLKLNDHFVDVGFTKLKARDLADKMVGIREGMENMMTDIQSKMFFDFDQKYKNIMDQNQYENQLRLEEQRRENDLQREGLDRRMKKETFSIIASVLIAGLAIALSIYFK
tara:strand:- start:4127 stop:4474 length:348 start_codon:yes stop_codon:yes gene_type:complete